MNRMLLRIGWTLAATLIFLGSIPLKAQDYSHIRIVRLSFVEGDVQYRQPGGDWQAAALNLPMQHGYALRTSNGFAEVEFEHGLVLRLASSSALDFTELALRDGERITRLNLSAGTAIITADLARHEELYVAASNLQLTVPRTGTFRVDASPAETFVTAFHGKVNVASPTGILAVSSGHALHEKTDDLSSLALARSPQKDAFDKWVSERDEALAAAQRETSDYFQPEYYTTGFGDLGLYGIWNDVPGYGLCWQPYGLGLGWMPFVNGQWMFMGNTGWNWISGEPWGWVPYHFGGWYNAPGYGWLWVPHGASLWQPATASFVQVNNQLGWTPNIATPTKPIKTLQGQQPSPTQVVLSSGNAGGSIRGKQVLPVARGNAITTLSGSALPVFRPAARQARQDVRPTGSAPNVPTGHAPALQSRAPASLPAPAISSAAAFGGAVRPSMPAPHSLPVSAPAFARSSSGFSGGAGGFGTRGNASATMNAGSVSGRAASSGASSGSSGGGSFSGGSSGSGGHGASGGGHR